MNWRLAAVPFSIVSVVVTGSIMVVVLGAGFENAQAMIYSAVVGVLLSVPTTYLLTRHLLKFIQTHPH